MQAQRVETRLSQDVRIETPHALMFLAVWFAAAAIASRAGWFENVSATALFIGGLFGTAGAFTAAYSHWEPFREWVLGRDLRVVTLLHALRMAPGLGFLLLYVDGTLPAAFALPAAGVDIFAGLTALIAGFTMVGSRGRRPTRGLLVWHWFGLAGFLFLVTMGALTSPGPLGLLIERGSSQAIAGWPLSLAPTFMGPLMILLHLVAVVALMERRRK